VVAQVGQEKAAERPDCISEAQGQRAGEQSRASQDSPRNPILDKRA
jgi:hypothetical protein